MGDVGCDVLPSMQTLTRGRVVRLGGDEFGDNVYRIMSVHRKNGVKGKGKWKMVVEAKLGVRTILHVQKVVANVLRPGKYKRVDVTAKHVSQVFFKIEGTNLKRAHIVN